MEAEPVLKVLVADDHPLILQGLRRTLEACEDIDVVGEARTGDEVVPLVERRRPDVVLLDMRMPGLASAECIRLIRESQPAGQDDRPLGERGPRDDRLRDPSRCERATCSRA